MELQDLKNKMVAVLGYGLEGRKTVDYLLKHGVSPTIFDQKKFSDWDSEQQQAIKDLGINFIFGPDCYKELAGFEVIFRSPGIPLSHPDLLGLAKKQEGKVIFTSQTIWFFDHSKAKIIGVTGTKGKGTTSTLIYEILKASGEKIKAKSYLTGNIGKIQPFEILDELAPDDLVVYELSSFQLQDLKRSPHIGVVLMTTSEHLDYHKDIKEYHQAKCPIVKFQTEEDIAIINKDFPASVAIGSYGKGQKKYFSTSAKVPDGCYVQDDKIILSWGGKKSITVLPTNKLLLRGKHNLQNVCAAVLAAWAAGCPLPVIKQVLQNFKGLKHRLELVSEKQGIKFYNDSFSTTPETAIAAINSFTENEVLILGGSSKNSDFTELANTLAAANNVKAIIFIGPEGKKIKNLLNGRFSGQSLEGAQNMEEIFTQIKKVASSGDVVLLSPACASFDMFKNYQDRGEQFINQVSKWPAKQ
ncbi:MAG: UDP-N-acetylmuramoyl-L-alanine--D-glutamate ligase [Candidatus Doudnabacteria bacterium]|nr:UDP-N-acetylmuramoyl-L-alanine--D-glutamate ligase [Candidatus Doudnabacteria bacterium]